MGLTQKKEISPTPQPGYAGYGPPQLKEVAPTHFFAGVGEKRDG